ncbi:MAG TPA: hypothetical protein VIM75_13510 [Ohtaekwangia sp.]|uniref:hypothetical protein n=1 Tax=Ohtaekwangia sp. TaxID=2066019 RepID=UPI002F947124
MSQNHKKTLLLLLLCSLISSCYGQYVEELEEDMPMGVLSPGEIQLVNTQKKNMVISYSLDKETWHTKEVSPRAGLLFTLGINDTHMYIKLCNKLESVVCDIYKMLPKKRYTIEFSIEHGKILLRRT